MGHDRHHRHSGGECKGQSKNNSCLLHDLRLFGFKGNARTGNAIRDNRHVLELFQLLKLLSICTLLMARYVVFGRSSADARQ